MTSRRAFILASAATTGTIGFGLAAPGYGGPDTATQNRSSESGQAGKSGRRLELLVLGGTGFIGPHMVRAALNAGHRVTLFNRGRSNRDLFPGVETLIGDRDGNLESLKDRSWDAVIDNSGYVPRHVSDSADLLRPAVGQYLFISSVSAYRSFDVPGIEEDYPLGVLDDESTEEVTNETYGPMKALCEQAVVQAYPETATIVRPGYIVGPGDRTDRWTYWPLRIRAGGNVLAPGTPADPVQIIDARDLARFVIGALEKQTYGTFNAVGPERALTMGTMLDAMIETTGSGASLVWVDSGTLTERSAFLPIWAPGDGPTAGLHRISSARARAAGMTYTAIDKTVRDTLAWWDSQSPDRQAAMRAGLRILGNSDQQTGPGPMSLEAQMQRETALLAGLGA
jgi:2'-hydroxyisoflavone reductase